MIIDNLYKLYGAISGIKIAEEMPDEVIYKSARIRPSRADDYRIVYFPTECRYHLEALVNGSWVDVYCDTESVDGGTKWVMLKDACRWSKYSLQDMRCELLGVEKPKLIVS